MKPRMHKNSLKAYASLKLEPIERAVLLSYVGWSGCTDRTINTTHRNVTGMSVQPRITSLLDKGMLVECGDVKCPVSGRTVRTCKITALGRKALKG